MQIRQKEDGSGEIIFSDEEITILNKHKKLILSKYFLKHFVNVFGSLFARFQRDFPEELKNMETPYGDI